MFTPRPRVPELVLYLIDSSGRMKIAGKSAIGTAVAITRLPGLQAGKFKRGEDSNEFDVSEGAG
jgi:hypothetical protein